MLSVKVVFWSVAIWATTCAGQSPYKSRPDLSPPELNITIPCPTNGCASGYLFVSPFCGSPNTLSCKPVQPGNYILTSAGDLVFSGFSYYSPWNANFQPAKWKGQDVLFAFEGLHDGPHGHGLGHHTFLNNHYQTVHELRAGGHYISDKHEFIINDDQKTALLQIWQPVRRDLSAFGGDEDHQWIVDAIFQELDIETGKVLFEWHSLDHVSAEEAILPLTKGQAGGGQNNTAAWDYFHINSIEKGTDGHYLLSARHISTIFKINGTDGSVIWRLGGNKTDFALGPEVEFGFQHHARYLQGSNDSVTLISLFDNSFYGSETSAQDMNVQIYPYSRGKYIAIDHVNNSASLLQAFHPPDDAILAKSQGSLQTVPCGNVLINWGSEGQITEYLSNGTIIFHAHLDSGPLASNVQNYRGFRYHWNGYSSEVPAIFAEVSGETARFYASWNGDTTTKFWRFSWHENNGQSPPIFRWKDVPRTGFETSLEVSVHDGQGRNLSDVVATALDVDGRELSSTQAVAVVGKSLD